MSTNIYRQLTVLNFQSVNGYCYSSRVGVKGWGLYSLLYLSYGISWRSFITADFQKEDSIPSVRSVYNCNSLFTSCSVRINTCYLLQFPDPLSCALGKMTLYYCCAFCGSYLVAKII